MEMIRGSELNPNEKSNPIDVTGALDLERFITWWKFKPSLSCVGKELNCTPLNWADRTNSSESTVSHGKECISACGVFSCVGIPLLARWNLKNAHVYKNPTVKLLVIL